MCGKKELILILLVVLITVSIYIFHEHKDFLWDSRDIILNNETIRSIKNIPSILNPFLKEDVFGVRREYRPIRRISFTIDYFLFGLNAQFYYYMNVFYHILNVLLLYYFLTFVLRIKKVQSWFISLLFAVHPIAASNVCFIKNRSELLSAFFCFLTIIFYFKHYHNHKKRYYLLSIFSTLLAILSKQNALILPMIIILIHLFFEKRNYTNFKRWLIQLIPHIIIVIGTLMFQMIYLYNIEMISPQVVKSIERGYSLSGQSISTRLYTMSLVMVEYFKIIFVPRTLIDDYWFTIRRTLTWQVFFLLTSLFVLAGISIRYFLKRKLWAFGILWFLICLFPYSNIIKPLWRMISIHYLYLPALGVYIGVGSVWSLIAENRNWK